MPLYEYQCRHCNQIFESVHKMDEYLDGYPCPTCEFGIGKKIFTKLTTTYKDKDRHWGRSLYRSHDKDELIDKQKRKGGKK